MDTPPTEFESELVALIRRHWKWVLIGAIAGAITGVGYFQFKAPVYQSESWIQLEGSDFQRESNRQLVVATMTSPSFLKAYHGESWEELRRQLQVSSTPEDAFLKITVTGSDPSETSNHANQLGFRVSEALPALNLNVIKRAEMDSPIAPGIISIIVGAFVGALIGGIVNVVRPSSR